MLADALRDEITRNYDFFQRQLASFLKEHAGRFALLRSARLEGMFDTASEADAAGWNRFDDRLYSIQQVTAAPVELGIYANGLD